jgi:hypothetical protein
MNKAAYDEAWVRLLSARRDKSLIAIATCAERLAQEARNLDHQIKTNIEPCEHFLTLNGYCVDCGHNPLFDKTYGEQ